MKNKIFNLINVITLLILIFVGIMPVFNFSIASTTLKPGETTKDLSKIDGSKYPGILERVEVLKEKYPKWEFEFYNTGLDWDRFIALEYSPERDGTSRNPFNLIYDTFSGTWLCEYRGTKKYDNGRWYAASYQAVEYAADPRTYLNEYDIFSLKRVSTEKTNLSAEEALATIEEALAGRTYLVHAQSIYDVTESENVDFVEVVARIIQEQGKGGVLINGAQSADPEDTNLYYNPFNIGATGNSSTEVINNGIKYAKSKGWNTFEKGLRGGIQKVKNDYSDQNTSYFEKFNSTKTDYTGITHQYMQNITAPLSEGEFKKDLYKGADPTLKGMVYTFVVPLYDNMQKAATEQPNHFLAVPKGKKYTPPADPTLPALANLTTALNLRDGPGTNYNNLGTQNTGTLINVLKKESNNWYQVEVVKTGKKGYMAKRTSADPYDYFTFQFKVDATMHGKTKEYMHNSNQDNPSLPSRAETTTVLNVRKTATTSGAHVVSLPVKTIIEITEKVQNANGYTWYKIKYSLSKDGKSFSKTGYVARNEVSSNEYYFAYLIINDLSESNNNNNDTGSGGTTTTSEYPKTAKTTTSLNVRKGSGSTSSAIVTTLAKGVTINVKKKMANKNGYEWYQIEYNLVSGKYKNSGYVARNAVGSKDYYFNYTTTSSGSSSSTTSGYPKTAKTTTSLNVRKGSGSTSSAIATTLAKGVTINVKKKMANKNGYEWYQIEYNLVSGKYKNSGYVARNAVGSKDYYFNY